MWLNKTAMQNVLRALLSFFTAGGEGGSKTYFHKEVMGVATLRECNENIRSFAPPVTHLRVMLTDFFLHISSENGYKEWLLGKMPGIRIKQD